MLVQHRCWDNNLYTTAVSTVEGIISQFKKAAWEEMGRHLPYARVVRARDVTGGRPRRSIANGRCCEVTSSYATTPLLFEQRRCCLNNAPTKLVRGDYETVCIYQFPLFIPDKNKHEVSDQTFNCRHNRRNGSEMYDISQHL